jgi:ribosomal-protein-alanine N-acetyltransferase
MEKIFQQSETEGVPVAVGPASQDWRAGLPVLAGASVKLRELRMSDAPSLFAMLTADDVARFISPPPASLEGFERFIAWTLLQRRAGTYACFAVTLDSTDTAVGVFQLRSLESGFGTAEWGFAIGSEYWGSPAFHEGAELMVQFAFEAVGVHRLEARAAVRNERGN